MAYGYMRSDPVELFRQRAGYYQKLIKEAEVQGFTRQEAIELLKVDTMRGIEEALNGMNI